MRTFPSSFSSNKTANINVIKSDTRLETTTQILDFGESKIFPVNLFDSQGKGIEAKTVCLTMMKYDGSYIYPTAVTDSEGIANFDLSTLDAGLWIIFGNFTGDDVYNPSNFTDKFVAVKMLTNTSIEEISDSHVGSSFLIHSLVISESGIFVNDGMVHFIVDNTEFHSINLKYFSSANCFDG